VEGFHAKATDVAWEVPVLRVLVELDTVLELGIALEPSVARGAE